MRQTYIGLYRRWYKRDRESVCESQLPSIVGREEKSSKKAKLVSFYSHVLLLSKDSIVRLELVLGEQILSLGDLDVELQVHPDENRSKRRRREGQLERSDPPCS